MDLGKEIVKDEKRIEKTVENSFGKSKINPWIIVSVVLAIALVGAFVWPKGISSATAGEKLVTFLNANVVQGGGVTLKDVQAKGDLYQVNVLYKGQEIPVYITKDGNYFVQGATEIAAATKNATSDNATAAAGEPAATDVPKSDKPKAEAFVFAYCPYGLQFEKALLPAYNLLKDKADISVVYIGAMHGDFEKVESFRQLCIKKLYGNDKLMAYLGKFIINNTIGGCSGDAACVAPLLSPIYSSLGINGSTVDSCMSTDAQALYDADGARASSLGISGSPTFVINGVETSVSRTPDAIKTAICSAFATAPSECNQSLSTGSMTAGFGSSSGASTGASCG
jgi:hypothetical protein